MDRPGVLQTIKVYRDTVERMCTEDPEWAHRVVRDDPTAFRHMLECACAATGSRVEEYEEALAGDADLRDLQKRAIDEVIVGSRDPGPYDVVSRESPAGSPANWHINTASGVVLHGSMGRRR